MVDKIDKDRMARTCTTWSQAKPAADYYPNHARCKACYSIKQREWYLRSRPEPKPRLRTDPEILKARKRAAAYQRRMGITEEQRDAMFAEQGYACGMCGTSESRGRGWCTDHDHRCCPQKARSCGGCIRGVICYGCNTALGHARDSVTVLQAGIDYLNRWEEARRG